MNYLSKIVLMGFPIICTASLFSAYIMDSGRMNNEPGFDSSTQNHNYGNTYGDLLSFNSPSSQPMLDSTPSMPQDTYYQYPTPGMNPDQRKYQDGGQFNPNPNRDMHYNNKNHDWADRYIPSNSYNRNHGNDMNQDWSNSYHQSNSSNDRHNMNQGWTNNYQPSNSFNSRGNQGWSNSYRQSNSSNDRYNMNQGWSNNYHPSNSYNRNQNNDNQYWADNNHSSNNHRNNRSNARDDQDEDDFKPSNSTRESRWVIADNSQKISTIQQHAPRTDDDISQKIRLGLRNDPSLSGIAKEIEVSVRNGNVTLKGNVHSVTEKNKIDYIANSVDGVKNVSSKITVQAH